MVNVYDNTVDKMYGAIDGKIEHYEFLIKCNDNIIASRYEEIRETSSKDVEAVLRHTIKRCTEENKSYYQFIRDLQSIKDAAF